MNLTPRGNDRDAPDPRSAACLEDDNGLSELSAAIWRDTPPMTDDELRIAADIAWAAELGLDDRNGLSPTTMERRTPTPSRRPSLTALPPGMPPMSPCAPSRPSPANAVAPPRKNRG